MTQSVSTDVDPGVDVASLRILILLSLGEPLPAAPIDWTAVSALAERERLLGVAWKTAAGNIRSHAPAMIQRKWQRQALSIGLHAERQLELLAETIAALEANAIEVVVLKGAPLAQRLYGDFTVRPSLDLDLYVPARQRASATIVLTNLGWWPMSGVAPEEETLERTDGARLLRIEVHSSALDDALLEHVRFPIEQQRQSVGPYQIPSHSGPLLPAYLATHLIKHHEKPLLWAVDFFLLWKSLSVAEQRNAMAAAQAAGASRHLRWAIALAAEIEAVRSGAVASLSAARALAQRLVPRGDLGRLVQLVTLSQSPMAALHVVTGRVWPPARRRGWRKAPGYFWRRAIRWSYRHLVFERPVHNERRDGAADVVSLSAGDCEQRLFELLRRAPVWVSPADAGMEPAIPAFAFARVVPIERELRVGDVVLVRTAPRRCVLRRVTALGSDELQILPDTQENSAHLVARSAVLGICDVVEVDGCSVAITDRPHGSLGTLKAIIRSQFRTPQTTRGASA